MYAQILAWQWCKFLANLRPRFCGSQDVFGNKSPDKSINYVIAHDGFTLRDLVSYNHKHNFANGENNRDGSDNNNSNNHGAEGETDDIEIRNSRQKSMRNILTTLLLSRGTPMLSMGCEIGHTQFGNNNSYAQDNGINYIDWENADLELLEFTKKLISLRQELEFLRGDIFFDGHENPILRDIEFLNQAALPFEHWQWNDANYPIMCMQIAKDKNGILIIINRSHSAQSICLPSCFSQNSWHVESDSANLLSGEITNAEIEIAANSIVILAARRAKIPINRQLDDATLGKLCEIYGIDTTWWDVEGNETQVPRETKIAILRAMGINCETFEDGKIAIDNWVKNVQLRALPHVASFDQDSEISIEIIRNVSNPRIKKIAFEWR